MDTTRIESAARIPSAPPGAPDPAMAEDPEQASLLPQPAGAVLPEASLAGLAMLLAAMDQDDQRSSRKLAAAADRAATQEADQQVQALRDKAGADALSGFVEGAGTALGGVCTGLGILDTSSDLSTFLKGGADGSPGIGKMVAAGFASAAGNDGAEAARAQANSESDVRRYNRGEDEVHAAQQSIQKIEQFLEQVQQTENATRLAAISGRA